MTAKFSAYVTAAHRHGKPVFANRISLSCMATALTDNKENASFVPALQNRCARLSSARPRGNASVWCGGGSRQERHFG
jgi:hypothetical protein